MALTNPKDLKMVIGSFYIPKNNPNRPAGEDAHFCSKEEQVIGVADGVGGWAMRGIDSGEFARELMTNAAGAVKDSTTTPVDPKNVLEKAFVQTTAQGSSTACILSLDGNRLSAANLGDSGFMVIRQGRTFYSSPVQQNAFNFPYQLGKLSGYNVPEEADKMVVEMERGDIIIVGTDGLFDNVFPEDIEKAVEYCLEEDLKPETMACVLALIARRNSLDERNASPFEVAAYKAGFAHFGGKYDDITVVVAYIILPQSSTDID